MKAYDNEQKAAILRRLRGMLLRKKETFQRYLVLLEREGVSIACGDVERLQVELELEKNVIAEIHSLHRVIEPLEDLYRAAYPDREETVPALTRVLEKMGVQLKERNARNRAALKAKMEELRQEINGLHAWPHTHAAFAETTPSLIDITT